MEGVAEVVPVAVGVVTAVGAAVMLSGAIVVVSAPNDDLRLLGADHHDDHVNLVALVVLFRGGNGGSPSFDCCNEAPNTG